MTSEPNPRNTYFRDVLWSSIIDCGMMPRCEIFWQHFKRIYENKISKFFTSKFAQTIFNETFGQFEQTSSIGWNMRLNSKMSKINRSDKKGRNRNFIWFKSTFCISFLVVNCFHQYYPPAIMEETASRTGIFDILSIACLYLQ